jgi:hypothetical protein
MSVTGLLRDKNFVNQLRNIYPAYALKPSNDLLLPPRYTTPSLIGTAFDYSLRIHSARLHKFKHPHLSWEVDGIPLVLSVMDDICFLPKKIAGFYVSDHQKGLGARRLIWALDVLRRAKVLAIEYHKYGQLSNDFLWAMFQISSLEMVMRSRKVEYLQPDQLDEPDSVVIDELRSLIELAETSKLKVNYGIYLSPGLRSDFLTYGASPDLFVDGWLCDIKAASRFGDAYRWTDQLVLYSALAQLSGFNLQRTDCWNASYNNHYGSKVNGVAVYFARHGEWVAVPMAKLVNPSQLKAVQTLLCKQYLGSKKTVEVERFMAKIRRH